MISRFRNAAGRELREISNAIRPRVFLANIASGFLPDKVLYSLRNRIYCLAGCKICRGATMLGRVTLSGTGNIARRLQIGEGSIIAPGVVFNLDGEIRIGRNVSIGPSVKLCTATHTIGFGSRRMAPTVRAAHVVIEDGVWVGMDSLILPGVVLGRGCVVSAGSVVTRSVPPNTLVAGNPAVVQKELPFGDR
jgi:acetyltransferase-like isoleucine patch superfamily enzyme